MGGMCAVASFGSMACRDPAQRQRGVEGGREAGLRRLRDSVRDIMSTITTFFFSFITILML